MEHNIQSNQYEFKIISRDEISNGKVLKQYDINNEKVIGVYENEPFMIQFKNNSWNRVQVKFSIDGTDILTGKLADTSVTSEMWVCEAYSTLELKAFPETNKGGAEFIFGKVKDSVAVNTHGVQTGIGYIAVAVYVEESINQDIFRSLLSNQETIYNAKPYWQYNNHTYTYGGSGGSSFGNSGISYNIGSLCASSSPDVVITNSVTNSVPAVGAGEYVAQEIVKTAGLKQPKLFTTMSIKYEWWTSLRSKIRQTNNKPINPAFPGDHQEVKMLDLKKTPRKRKSRAENKAENKYPELNRFG